MTAQNNLFNPAVFSSFADTQPKPASWESIVDTIREVSLKQATLRYRDLLRQHDAATDKAVRAGLEKQMSAVKSNVPSFLPMAVVEGGRCNAHVRGYSGFLMIDIDHIPQERFKQVCAAIIADRHTFMGYATISGRGYRVIVRTDVTPDAALFKQAWTAVNAWCEQLTGLPTDRQCKNATRISCMCHDAAVHFNAGAEPFTAEDISRLAGAEPGQPGQRQYKQGGGRHPTVKRAEPVVRRIVESRGLSYCEGHHNEYISQCLYLMNRFGVKFDDALGWALKAFADYDACEHSVEATARSCYRNHAEYNTLSITKFTGYNNKQTADDGGAARRGRSSATEIRDWIRNRVEARYNVFSGKVEIKMIYKNETQWRAESGRDDATLWVDMENDGLKTETKYVATLLQSEFAAQYNPMQEYIDALPAWDGTTDHICQMADLVTVKGSQELWRNAFKQWMTGLIAGVFDERVVNQVMLCLIGPQGGFKTTFVNYILPPELRQYANVMTNMRNFSKDDALKICENILIVCEEIDTMQPADLNRFKALMTQLHVDERRAYARHKEHRPHIASFFATGNNEQFLTDETGNRRFLPFVPQHIDNPMHAAINYRGVYAQAYALWKSGFKYWLDAADVTKLRGHVSNFEAPRPEYELILSRYCKPREGDVPKYMSSSEILASFGCCGIKLSVIMVGRAMMELGFDFIIVRGVRKWIVVELRPGEMRDEPDVEVF